MTENWTLNVNENITFVALDIYKYQLLWELMPGRFIIKISEQNGQVGIGIETLKALSKLAEHLKDATGNSWVFWRCNVAIISWRAVPSFDLRSYYGSWDI